MGRREGGRERGRVGVRERVKEGGREGKKDTSTPFSKTITHCYCMLEVWQCYYGNLLSTAVTERL